MNLELRATHDGSHTLYNPQLNETYHSIFGAVRESIHVFIQAGLHCALKEKSDISLLEVGFGTGLNAWLTLQEVLYSNNSIHYVGLEPYPVPLSIIEQLNYIQVLNSNEHRSRLFYELHKVDWEKFVAIHPSFEIHKIQKRLEEFESGQLFDLIYFDAFAPSKHLCIWQKPMLQKLYDLTAPGGLLITYCAKGQFKRDLKEVGWQVEALPGPPGKREITRAFK